MSEVLKNRLSVISSQDADIRWQQAIELYSTFTEIWIQNPQLARQAGRRVEEHVMPIAEVQLRHVNDLI